MIPDFVFTSRDLYASNQVRSRPTYLSSLGATGLYIKDLCYFVNVITDKANVCTNEKSLLRLAGLLP